MEWSGRGHLEQNQIGLKRKVGICPEEKVRKTRVVAVVEWDGRGKSSFKTRSDRVLSVSQQSVGRVAVSVSRPLGSGREKSVVVATL